MSTLRRCDKCGTETEDREKWAGISIIQSKGVKDRVLYSGDLCIQCIQRLIEWLNKREEK